MQAEKKKFLEKRFGARAWRGHSKHGKRAIKGISVEQWEIPGWKLQRVQHDHQEKLITIRSLWGHGESTSELLAIDVFESPSVEAAHDQVLEALGNMESGAIEQQTGKDTPGDVAFGLNDTMILFARANLVVLIRNAGPSVVRVGNIARQLDRFILRRLETKPRDKD